MKVKYLVQLFVILLAVTAACNAADLQPPLADGQVFGLTGRTALMVIRDAANGASGTARLTNGSGYLFAKTIGDGWAFVAVDAEGKRTVSGSIISALRAGGNVVNVRTFSEFANALGEKGWKSIPASALPPAIVTAANQTSSWLMALAKSAMPILIVPSGIFEYNPVLDQYQSVQD